MQTGDVRDTGALKLIIEISHCKSCWPSLPHWMSGHLSKNSQCHHPVCTGPSMTLLERDLWSAEGLSHFGFSTQVHVIQDAYRNLLVHCSIFADH